jgi:hypothetical protein
MVTDSLGNQTGLQTNGMVLEAIPNSSYEPAMADSEDESIIDPTGPKTVRIDTPMAGTYRVDLTGTDSGPYTLDWQQINANGTPVGTNTYTGTVSSDQVITYFINAVPTGPPPLLFTLQANALVLFWPTNYAGFTVQANANPTDSKGWAPIGAPSASGAFNFVTNPIGTANEFFRLEQ